MLFEISGVCFKISSVHSNRSPIFLKLIIQNGKFIAAYSIFAALDKSCFSIHAQLTSIILISTCLNRTVTTCMNKCSNWMVNGMHNRSVTALHGSPQCGQVGSNLRRSLFLPPTLEESERGFKFRIFMVGKSQFLAAKIACKNAQILLLTTCKPGMQDAINMILVLNNKTGKTC